MRRSSIETQLRRICIVTVASFIVIVILTSFVGLITRRSFIATANGFKKNFHEVTYIITRRDGVIMENDHLYAYENGKRVTGWYTDNGKTYYFNTDGDHKYQAVTSWQTIKGKKYYFYDDEDKYGQMAQGIVKLGKKTYYFNDKGVMSTGVQTVDGHTYYFSKKGVMRTGWFTKGDKTYYMDENGIAVTGKQTIDNQSYEFDENGAIETIQYKMDKKAQGLSSQTNYLCLVQVNGYRVSIYQGSKGNWKRIQYYECSVGMPGRETKLGTWTMGKSLGRAYHQKYFDSEGGRLWYATRIDGPYLFHSVLYTVSSTPSKIKDGRLGEPVSHGCIRLDIKNAKWIYDTIPEKTKCVTYND